MARNPKAKENGKTVESLRHKEASRKNIPTAEYQSVIQAEHQTPIRVAYERRNRDLDPQLVWRGKDDQVWSDLVVHAPPLYIQEKVQPKVLIDDLLRRSKADREAAEEQFDLFSDFNGLPSEEAKTEFYQHDANWSNRMILGDSLQVMASLAEREGLRGQVQCIYIDPPYGIKFNSNFQWSTTSRDVKDGNVSHITREPEQVKAFRDTWRDGIHSYLTYLRDRLTVLRDLLKESGSIFLQIGDENVHRVRALLDEVFGEENFKSEIAVTKSTGLSTAYGLVNRTDYVLWYCRNHDHLKVRTLFLEHDDPAASGYSLRDDAGRLYMSDNLTKPGPGQQYDVTFQGRTFDSGKRWWGLPPTSMSTVAKAGRLAAGAGALRFKRFFDDFPYKALTNLWDGIPGAPDPSYVVQTHTRIVERCILMTTDPGDLVLDPTCGSGTTATVAEQWGRRWITVDTSRVALALARARIMGARYPFYLLADSVEGQLKEAETCRTAPSSQPTRGDIRQGFVYQRVPHITLKSIANNSEIDVIWDRFQEILEPLRQQINQALGRKWAEWEVPRQPEEPWNATAERLFHELKNEQARDKQDDPGRLLQRLQSLNLSLKRNYTLQTLPDRPADPWPEPARALHAEWLRATLTRQKEIDTSIAAIAESEFLYDKPYEDRTKVRVAGPFTVESLSPHRIAAVDENDELVSSTAEMREDYGEARGFVSMILENLRAAGVQQSHKEDKITFVSVDPWPGDLICADGRYRERVDGTETARRAAIFIGPEFGTVSRPDLVAAAREAGDAGFDILITCAFNYDARSSEFNKLGCIPVLKARMNADLHMAGALKNTGKGNLFVIFGEPDIELLPVEDDRVRVRVNGVDVFDPNTGEVRSDGADGIACWFIDTDYNEESFFVRHAYFLGATDPYSALRNTLKAEISEEAWDTLSSSVSRPFRRPDSGRIAVKAINRLGDEVMKVFKV